MSGQCNKKRLKPESNAARERSRVQSLRTAFLELQRSLPSVPRDTKLSKLDTLVLATAYIYNLTETLEGQGHISRPTNNIDEGMTDSYYLYSPKHSRPATTIATAVPTTLKPATATRPTNDGTNISSSKTQTVHEFETTQTRVIQYRSEPTHNSLNVKHGDGVSGSSSCQSSKEIVIISKADNPCYYEKGKQFRCMNEDVHTCSDAPSSSSLCGELDILARTQRSNVHWTNKSRDRIQLRPKLLSNRDGAVGILHPVKKWPMRYRMYDILGHEPIASRLCRWTRQENDHL